MEKNTTAQAIPEDEMVKKFAECEALLIEKDKTITELRRNLVEAERTMEIDYLTRVKSSWALARELKDFDVNETALAMVNIYNMKSINAIYGTETGDGTIMSVAFELKVNFDASNIYRFGSGFFIVGDRKDMEFMRRLLQMAYEHLKRDNIDISYTIKDGNDCMTMQDLKDLATSEFKQQEFVFEADLENVTQKKELNVSDLEEEDPSQILEG